MLKLIRNEMIKIFSKISTWIMLGLVLLLIIGMTVIMKISYNMSYSYDYTYTKQDIESELQYLESSRPQGYELDMARFSYMAESGKEWNTSSWEMTALQEAFATWKSPLIYEGAALSEAEKNQHEENFAREMAPVLEGNWEEYARVKLEQIDSSGDSAAVKEAARYYYDYMLKNGIAPGDGDWRENTAQQIAADMQELAALDEREAAGSYVSEENRSDLEDDLALARYRLDNGIEHYMDGTGYTDSLFWSVFQDESGMLILGSVVLIVIAGGCVANEFSTGTIKFLLINPVKRSKIIISKYLTLVILSAGMVLAMWAAAGIVDLIVLGAQDIGMPYLTVQDQVVSAGTPLWHVLGQYALNSVNLLAMMTMAFMISSLLRSSALAIGIGVAALMGGSMVSMLLAQLGCDWGRYLLFANLDIGSISQGYGYFPNQTVGFALATVAVYLVVFLLTAFDGFTKREV